MNCVKELNESNFAEELSRETTPAVVDFFAPWCGPCRMLGPAMEAVAAEYGGRVRFYKINIDEAPALASGLGITSVPTLLLISEGRVRDAVAGFLPPQRLKEWIESAGVPATMGA